MKDLEDVASGEVLTTSTRDTIGAHMEPFKEVSLVEVADSHGNGEFFH